MRAATTEFARNYSPSYRDLAGKGAVPGIWLPEFIVSGVLGCAEGYIPDDFASDEGVNRVFNLRSGPISAAILIDIDLPAELDNPSS